MNLVIVTNAAASVLTGCAVQPRARRLIGLLVMASAIAGCATPVVMLRHDPTGQIARCGGGMGGSMAFGYVGYTIEQSNDERCVRDYEAQGFKRIRGGSR